MKDVRTRYEIPGACWDITFTNPLTSDNGNNWIGAKYMDEEESMILMANGEIRELPDDLLRRITFSFPNSQYRTMPGIYEWKGIAPEELVLNFGLMRPLKE